LSSRLRVEGQLVAQTPTEPGVRISRTGLFRIWFTAPRTFSISHKGLKVSDAVWEKVL
jgi:hypothetical protein